MISVLGSDRDLSTTLLIRGKPGLPTGQIDAAREASTQTVGTPHEITALRRTLKAMDRSLRRLAPKLQAAGNGHPNGREERRTRKLRLSPKRRAQLKLQGQYLGYMKQLRGKQWAEVKSLRLKKGFRMAVAGARKLLDA